MKVVVWTVFICGLLYGKGGLTGLRRGVRMFGGLGMQVQTYISSVRNIYEGSFTGEGMGI